MKNSNHFGERLALDPEADLCVREQQLTRYWADAGHLRRTYRTGWCRDSSACAVDFGNHPEAYTMRLRATVEFPHHDRVVGRFSAVKVSNHLDERRLALEPQSTFLTRTIWGCTVGEEYVMTLLRCQACAVFLHTSRFDRRVRRAQYSLLHALDLSHVRRTYETVWCKDCSERAFDLGNHPEAYTMRIRATVEFLHQDRVVGRLFAVKDSNHLGERLALDPEADQCVTEQLSRYWADTTVPVV